MVGRGVLGGVHALADQLQRPVGIVLLVGNEQREHRQDVGAQLMVAGVVGSAKRVTGESAGEDEVAAVRGDPGSDRQSVAVRGQQAFLKRVSDVCTARSRRRAACRSSGPIASRATSVVISAR